MRKAALLLACAFLINSQPALAATDSEKLRLVETEHRTLVAREYVVRRHDRYRGGHVTQVITPGRVLDVYIAQGPIRISEGQFVGLIERSGVDPILIQGIHDRDRKAFVHGGLALGGFIGSAVAGGVAELEFGSQDVLAVRTGPNQVAINTAAIAALVLAGVGVVYTLFWLGDTSAKGAPFFHDFTVDEARQAIDAYNRKLDDKTL